MTSHPLKYQTDLFYPVAAWTYYGAWKDGVLSAASIIGSLAIGSAVMATPIVLLKIKSRPAFNYSGQHDASQLGIRTTEAQNASDI